MLIVPLPWNRSELEYLRDTSDLFDLIMNDSTQQYYLIIEDDTMTWIGQGSVPGQLAHYIKSRSFTINEERCEIPKNLGNVGFMGKYSGIEEAILKLFPKTGYCISNMKYTKYTGQKLKGVKDHYSVITLLQCLLERNPSAELKRYFKILGWGNRVQFTCSGTWEDMELYVDGCLAPSLEEWFAKFCSIALGDNQSAAQHTTTVRSDVAPETTVKSATKKAQSSPVDDSTEDPELKKQLEEQFQAEMDKEWKANSNCVVIYNICKFVLMVLCFAVSMPPLLQDRFILGIILLVLATFISFVICNKLQTLLATDTMRKIVAKYENQGITVYTPPGIRNLLFLIMCIVCAFIGSLLGAILWGIV